MKSKFAPIFSSLALFLITGCDTDTLKTDTAQSLLNSFADGCPSVDGWTERAIGQAEALQASLLTLQKQKGPCERISDILPALIDKTRAIKKIVPRQNNSDDPMREELKIRHQLKNQTLLLHRLQSEDLLNDSDPTNDLSDHATEIATLKDQILSTRLNLFEATSDVSTSKKDPKLAAQIEGIQTASDYIDTVLSFSASADLQACMAQNPLLSAQLGLSAVSVAGTFLTSNLGTALVLAGNTLQRLVTFLQTSGVSTATEKIKGLEMKTAVRCVLMSLEENYCAADEAETLLLFQGKQYKHGKRVEPFWRGVDLWTDRLHVIFDWLKEVSDGVIPNNVISAQVPLDARGDDFQLSNLRFVGKALIKETINNINNLKASGDLKSADDEFRRGYRRLVDLMTGHGVILETLGKVPVIYRLAGQKQPDDPSKYLTSESISFNPPEGAGFGVIGDRANEIFDQIGRQVKSRLSKVLFVTARSLVRSATQKSTIGGKESPVEVLIQIKNFLRESRALILSSGQPDAARRAKEISHYISFVQDTITLIQTWEPDSPTADQDSIDVLDEIYLKFNLEYQEEKFRSELRQFVINDLTTRYQMGQMPNDVSHILNVGGHDVLQDILNVGSTSEDSGALASDIRNAKGITLNTIQIFLDTFSGAINSTLRSYRTDADRYHNLWTNEKHDFLAPLGELCLLLATATDQSWPSGIDFKPCAGFASTPPGGRGTQVESTLAGVPPLPLHLVMEKIANKDQMHERVCVFRRYRQQALIYVDQTPNDPEAFFLNIFR